MNKPPSNARAKRLTDFIAGLNLHSEELHQLSVAFRDLWLEAADREEKEEELLESAS